METSFYSEAFSILQWDILIFTPLKPLFNLKVSITNPKGEAYLKSKFQVDSAVIMLSTPLWRRPKCHRCCHPAHFLTGRILPGYHPTYSPSF